MTEEAHNEGSSKSGTAPKGAPVWPWLVSGAVVIIFIGGVLLAIFLPHENVTTDDAFVTAHYATITPRVSGQVINVAAGDNQPVQSGQLLVALDPSDFNVALNQANGQVAQDMAQAEQASAQFKRQPAIIIQAEAQLNSANAAFIFAQQNAARYMDLSSIGAGSTQQRQQAVAQFRQTKSDVDSAAAQISADQSELLALQAVHDAALGKLRVDEAQVESARLNLSYTQVRAPINGVVDQRAVQVGDFVSPQTAMMSVVPLGAVYIVANYRELQLHHMRPGQHARIHVDAYDIWLDGIVESVAPSTGAAYAEIPSDNATGNFTKIVQRFAAKIVVAPGQPLANLLRVGMSVEVTVKTGLSNVVAEQQKTQHQNVTLDSPPAAGNQP